MDSSTHPLIDPALSVQARLLIAIVIWDGPQTKTELILKTGLSYRTVERHLSLLVRELKLLRPTYSSRQAIYDVDPTLKSRKPCTDTGDVPTSLLTVTNDDHKCRTTVKNDVPPTPVSDLDPNINQEDWDDEIKKLAQDLKIAAEGGEVIRDQDNYPAKPALKRPPPIRSKAEEVIRRTNEIRKRSNTFSHFIAAGNHESGLVESLLPKEEEFNQTNLIRSTLKEIKLINKKNKNKKKI